MGASSSVFDYEAQLLAPNQPQDSIEVRCSHQN